MSDQKIRPLSDEDQARLEAQRGEVTRFLSAEDLAGKFQTAAGKLGTIRAILVGGVFKPEQTYQLQSLGVVLGDVFVQDMGFTWVMVEDEYGRDPALRYEESDILLYPLTMISKGVEDGQTVDVFDLYNGLAAQVESLIKKR
jgi:hypothetical protein